MIDLRTDAISRPTEAMIEAMVVAARSAPGFGLTEDPFVARLERLAAEKLGKESALFCPTCTLCNQLAVHIFSQPGESFVAEALSHIIVAEAGAVASMSGVMPVPVPGTRGIPDPVQLKRAVRKGDELRSRTALIVMENTHVYSGGSVVPTASMQEIAEFSRQVGIPIHLDGARVFNAAAFLGIPAEQIARNFDSVAFSLNKGLAAPLGAILAGDRQFIRAAVRVRQMFGGGWRPAGILAAAGIVALETMIDRIGEDHRHARRLADGLATCNGVAVDPESVDTNIVLAQIETSHISVSDLIRKLEEEGVLILELAAGPANTIRMVTHHEIRAEHIDRAIDVFANIMSARPSQRG